jgi:hypothetical protein
MINSGPFILAPGDTQEVVFGFIGAAEGTYLSNITLLKFYARQLRLWYPYLGQFVSQGRTRTWRAMLAELFATRVPNRLALSPNYPNPFHENTSIDYSLTRDGEVELIVYDVLGREIAVLQKQQQKAGLHHVNWTGRDRRGHALPAGIYFLRLRANNLEMIRKLVIVR